MKQKEYGFTGTTSVAVSERERRSRALARKAAAEGMVLLKNNGVLPVSPDTPVALFGAGAAHTVKGGTGSGDVNERECISIRAGMEQAGYTLTSSVWLEEYEQEYARTMDAYRKKMMKILDGTEEKGLQNVIIELLEQVFVYPKGRPITAEDLAGAEVAFYVISRVTGEGADRYDVPGEYRLSAEEEEHIRILSESSSRLVVVVNAGSPIDLSFLDRYEIDALIQLSQPGMEGGNAFADVIRGAVCPCGKLTDTWAKRYADYPGAQSFSHNNGNVQEELYEEGIYVGYRYFDSFQAEPAFAFGYGLSYTQFSLDCTEVSVCYDDPDAVRITAVVQVTNTGAVSGRETVQVYAACPQGKLTKEYKRLCGFAKTGLLEPGKSETVTVEFPLQQLTSFDEEACAYVLEAGEYVIAVGNSSDNVRASAVLTLEKTLELTKTTHICPLRGELHEIAPAGVPAFAAEGAPDIALDPARIGRRVVQYEYGKTENPRKAQARALAEQMEGEQLIAFCCGQMNAAGAGESVFGAAGELVPGAAGQTSNMGRDLGIAEMVVADGPAGLRLEQCYRVRGGKVQKSSNPAAALIPPLRPLFPEETAEDDVVYYQFCTAFPVGTMLAQTWDTELIEQIGRAVSNEMNEMRIGLWLAPGMNLHRNPLCGRNFEYYSEDPLLSGKMAAAMTRGVQSGAGTGTTIKHFACNNQEDNRMGSDTVISERALRELYLHNFEIAVREAQPMAVMSSYNLVNGIHTANSHDLLSKVLRDEWGFEGLVMTDWTTTNPQDPFCSQPAECVRSGNDLIMPGSVEDIERLRKAAADGTLDWEDIRRCAANVIDIILRSNCYEGAKPYGKAEWREV